MPGLSPSFDPDRWVPPPELVDGYRITEFLRMSGCPDLRSLWARSVNEPDWFYRAAFEYLDIPWPRPWESVRIAGNGEPHTRWFVGGATNLAWLAAGRWAGRGDPAIIWESDDGQSRTLTFAQLDDEIARAAAGLRAEGVGHGDVVAMHLPAVPEAIIVMLAAARIGAIVAPAFSGYGPDALAERIRISGAKVLVTADGTRRRGKLVPMIPTALAASDACPAVRRIVIIRELRTPLPRDPRVKTWSELCSVGSAGPYELFDPSTPWILLFTSGSTGRPKGAVHTHGGLGISVAIDLGLTLDVRPADRFCFPADLGWLAGPMAGIGPLTLGATAVLFAGVHDFPAASRMWSLIERHQVTQYGLSPSVARSMADLGAAWVEPYELASLRVILSTGEPWTLSAWKWLHRHVGRGWRPIVNWSGGTEAGGPIVTGFPSETMEAMRFWGPQLGFAADVVDPNGRSVVGTEGELVVRRSWPQMTQGLWREPDRFIESYWSRFPGLWVQGDRAKINEDGTYEILGRSDDVLKIAGKRVGPVELEAMAAEVEGVVEAAAIGIPHETKGEVAVIAIRVDDGHRQDASIGERVADHVTAAFGKPMRPAAVLVVGALPMTRSGKVHRRVLRGWVTGMDPGDVSSLLNPEAEALVAAAATAGSLRA